MWGLGSVVLERVDGENVDWGVREVRVYFLLGGGGCRSASISERNDASSLSACSSRVGGLGGDEGIRGGGDGASGAWIGVEFEVVSWDGELENGQTILWKFGEVCVIR